MIIRITESLYKNLLKEYFETKYKSFNTLTE